MRLRFGYVCPELVWLVILVEFVFFWLELVRLVILAEFGLCLHAIGGLVIALELVIRHCGWVMFGWCWFCFLICRYG